MRHNSLPLFFIVLVSGLATKFFREVNIVILLTFVSFVYLVVTRAVMNKRYIFACLVWVVYVILSYLKYPGNNLFWPFLYICNISIAYAVIRYYGGSLTYRYTEIIYFLAWLSLVFYLIQLIALDYMLPVWSAFDLSEKLFDKSYTYYSHTLFYTIHQFIDVEKGFPRNSGFAWEPGAFACFLIVGVYFQLLIDIREGRYRPLRYVVLLLALLTTFSTTGFIALIVLLISIFIEYRKKASGGILVTILLLVIALPYFGMDQLDKIENQLSADLGEHIYSLDLSEGERGLGRFQSIAILAKDFASNPLLGIGVNRSASWVAQMGLNVNPTSGIGNMFATYGLLLMVPFVMVLVSSSIVFAKTYGFGGRYLFALIVLIVGFSFSLLETPLFLSFIFYGLFVNDQRIRSLVGRKVDKSQQFRF